VQFFALQKGLQHAEKYGVISSSRRYSESFAGFPGWKPVYDILLATLTLNFGCKGVFPAFCNYKSAKDWYHCAYPNEGHTEDYERLVKEFVSARLRFIVYFLISSLSD
jgi:hypothetical protein